MGGHGTIKTINNALNNTLDDSMPNKDDTIPNVINTGYNSNDASNTNHNPNYNIITTKIKPAQNPMTASNLQKTMSNTQKTFSKLSDDTIKQYQKSGYIILGDKKHTGVEVCRWTKKALKSGKNCYKSIYGVKSHRCLQMTPTVDYCSFSCSFCWRRFVDRSRSFVAWDDPKTVLDQAIKAQRKLLIGFGGNKHVDKRILWEALHPAHVAISLDGEPTLYPMIVDLVQEINNRGMTSFLVTNGSIPERLKEFLDRDIEPTNIYLSLYATNSRLYEKVSKPFIKNAFERVLKSLELLARFRRARTIIRLTLVRGLNMCDAVGYAKLALKANPWFIELKGYTWTGQSRQRLPQNAMPSMQEINEFGNKISKETNYLVKARDKLSRVVVMVRDEETWAKSLDKIKEQNKAIERLVGVAPKNLDERYRFKLKT